MLDPTSAQSSGWKVPVSRSNARSTGERSRGASSTGAPSRAAETSDRTWVSTRPTCCPTTTWNCPPRSTVLMTPGRARTDVPVGRRAVG